MYRRRRKFGLASSFAAALGSSLGKRFRIDPFTELGRGPRPRIPEVFPLRSREFWRDPTRDKDDMSYGGGRYSKERHTYGRRTLRKSARYAHSLVRAGAQRLQFGLDDYTDQFGTYGAIPLDNFYSSAANIYRTPLHLWDVTAVANGIYGTYRTAQCGTVLAFNTPSFPSECKWITLSNPIEIRRGGSSATSTANTPLNSSLLRAVKAKFMFYAPQTYPTDVNIWLIQIREDSFHPPKYGTYTEDGGVWQADGTVLPTVTSNAHIAFWENMVLKKAKNPVAFAQNNATSHIKVLKRINFTLNPKETVDNTSTTYHKVELFHRFNRRVNYSWEPTDNINLQANDAAFVNPGNNKCSPEPKARIYIMVTANSKYVTEEVSNSLKPTYDFTLRLYHDDMGA